MEKRYDESLTTRLEDAMLHGCSHITWQELYHWYGVQKIAAGTWRDLAHRWEEITEGKGGPLAKVPGRDGIFIFDRKKIAPVDPDNG
jgi:hypothetical protein